MSTERWMEKEDVVFFTMQYYLAMKRNNVIFSNMSEPRDYHTKSDRQISWNHLHVESRKDTNKLIYKTEIDLQP